MELSGEREASQEGLSSCFSNLVSSATASLFLPVTLSALNIPVTEGGESYKGLGVEINLILLEGETPARGGSVWLLLAPWREVGQ